jgi:hypothetical protein
MAQLIPTWLIRNVSNGSLTVKANPDLTSPVYPSSASLVTIKPQTNVEIERSRLEEEQILNLRRKNLITMTPLVKSIESGTE